MQQFHFLLYSTILNAFYVVDKYSKTWLLQSLQFKEKTNKPKYIVMRQIQNAKSRGNYRNKGSQEPGKGDRWAVLKNN